MQQRILKIRQTLFFLSIGLLLSLQASALPHETPPAAMADILDALEQGEYSLVVEKLDRLKQLDLPSEWEKRVTYLSGHAHLKLGQYAEALIHLSIALAYYPQLADYALFNIARIFKETGYTFFYTESLRLLITQYPFSRLVPQVRLTLAKEEFAQQHFQEVITLLHNFHLTYEEAIQAPEALLLLGQALEALQKKEEAITAYQNLYFFYPSSLLVAQAEERLQALRGGTSFSLSSQYIDQLVTRGERLIEQGQHEEASQIFSTLLLQKIPPEKKALLLLRLGSTYEALWRWKEALSLLEQVSNHTIDPSLLQESWYRLGVIQKRRGSSSAARTYFQKVLSTDPKSEWSMQALYQLGRMAEEQDNRAQVMQWYTRLAKDFSGSDFAAELLWRLGWMEYSARHYTQAATHFQKFLSAYTQSSYRDNALFWLAKIQEKQNKKTEAIATYRLLVQQYPYTYHGYRAEVHLKRLAPDTTSSSNHVASSLEDPLVLNRSILSDEIRFHLSRAEELSLLRFYEDCREEILLLTQLLPGTAQAQFQLSQLYFRCGFYLESIRMLNTALSNMPLETRLALPAIFWNLMFPRLYWSQIQRVAAEQNIDPYLVLSVIRQESAFQRYALSRADARGLMQVVPSTGRELYRKLHGESLRSDQLFDPELNITLGTLYLTRLLRLYDGNLVLALASYNAGMGRVRQWRQKISERDWDEFVENIPFTETRGYVKNVLRNYHAYQKLYGSVQEEITKR